MLAVESSQVQVLHVQAGLYVKFLEGFVVLM